MGWLQQAVPNWAQWIGLLATMVGTAFSLWAVINSRGAKKQANLARQAAVRLGQIAQLGDLIAEMQELQVMLARTDFDSIVMKCNHLRGRVVRFKNEAYNDLSEEQAANLDGARAQLEIMSEVAVSIRATDSSRIGKIQLAYGRAHEALNQVFSGVRVHAEDEEQ